MSDMFITPITPVNFMQGVNGTAGQTVLIFILEGYILGLVTGGVHIG